MNRIKTFLLCLVLLALAGILHHRGLVLVRNLNASAFLPHPAA